MTVTTKEELFLFGSSPKATTSAINAALAKGGTVTKATNQYVVVEHAPVTSSPTPRLDQLEDLKQIIDDALGPSYREGRHVDFVERTK